MSEDPARARAIELIRLLALLDADLRSDYLAWAARLENPAEPFDPSELEVLRHSCHDYLTRLAASGRAGRAAAGGGEGA